MLNTLYITVPNRYLSLDGENIVILEDEAEIIRLPLHNLESVVTFGYTGASPALMEACAKRNIDLTFMTAYGKFRGRFIGEIKGNVTLRREQYRIADSDNKALEIARNMIVGKIYNSKWVLERATRDYALRLDTEKLKAKSKFLTNALLEARNSSCLEQLRGFEGEAAAIYFSVFNDLILQQKEDFVFKGRNKRPPRDNVNAMLSFAYSLLSNMCASALEGVGLDPYVGFIHTDRPGRISLALDLMEELRSVFADRFVLTLINKRILTNSDFLQKENGAVEIKDDARRKFLSAWQERKSDTIKHPFLEETIEWGLVPHAQALLLARYIRGDIDEYPPFLWK